MTTKLNPRSSFPINPIRIIAMILAQGVLRLQARQKALDARTEQRVHSVHASSTTPLVGRVDALSVRSL